MSAAFRSLILILLSGCAFSRAPVGSEIREEFESSAQAGSAAVVPVETPLEADPLEPPLTPTEDAGWVSPAEPDADAAHPTTEPDAGAVAAPDAAAPRTPEPEPDAAEPVEPEPDAGEPEPGPDAGSDAADPEPVCQFDTACEPTPRDTTGRIISWCSDGETRTKEYTTSLQCTSDPFGNHDLCPEGSVCNNGFCNRFEVLAPAFGECTTDTDCDFGRCDLNDFTNGRWPSGLCRQWCAVTM